MSTPSPEPVDWQARAKRLEWHMQRQKGVLKVARSQLVMAGDLSTAAKVSDVLQVTQKLLDEGTELRKRC